jgi:hypothetical protein
VVGRLGRRGQRQRRSGADDHIGAGDDRRRFHKPEVNSRNAARINDRLQCRRVDQWRSEHDRRSRLKRGDRHEQTGSHPCSGSGSRIDTEQIKI